MVVVVVSFQKQGICSSILCRKRNCCFVLILVGIETHDP